MQVMTRILLAAMLFWSTLIQSVAADGAGALALAMDAGRADDWDGALKIARPDGPIAVDLIEWQRLRAGLGTASEVTHFLEKRPDWPGLKLLRRKSEPALSEAGTARILAFYAVQPPQTAEGVLSYAAALRAKGRKGDAEAELVRAWRSMTMATKTQAEFLAKYGRILKPHHKERLDRMLWERNLINARATLPLVGPANRALGEARIALIERSKGVDSKISAVPKSLLNDPGLAYDRFVWRDRKGRDEDAIALLLARSTSAAALGKPGKWARRRANLARQDMRDGNSKRAYRIAARHYLTQGSSYADLEWLAGFIALRKLNDPATALKHFRRFEAAVSSPISKGRAGYWIGRAFDASGDHKAAEAAYTAGAKYQTSFYGLLAAERAGIAFDPVLAKPPRPEWRRAPFMQSSLLQAGLLLLDADEPDLAKRFLTHLADTLDREQATQLSEMALDMDRPHLALMIAKRTARKSVVLHAAYYPVHAVASQKLPMAPEMTLAIARRESEFNPVVISPAGARGLMQVMPATARKVAKDLGILAKHDTARLTTEWRYNARLGTNYLSGLAGKFNGNVVMMAAGYNAGPRRPEQWMQSFGDPRRAKPAGDEDIVDWIENIPFKETRNYVMRVAESLPVYRARLGKTPLPIPFSAELTGSTLRAFAP
jgi:peptidoglycan lytic transglycosylase